MDKNKVLSYLNSKKTQDYTYLIAFFIIFSFFIFALIRPNVLEIFSSFEKINQMKQVDSYYEGEITKSLQLQSAMEQMARNTYLLDDAVSHTPQVNKILNDMKILMDKYDLGVEKMNVSDINLKDIGKQSITKSVNVTVIMTGSFSGVSNFIKEIYNQRRLKVMKNIVIDKIDDDTASGSATLKVEMQITGFYL